MDQDEVQPATVIEIEDELSGRFRKYWKSLAAADSASSVMIIQLQYAVQMDTKLKR